MPRQPGVSGFWGTRRLTLILVFLRLIALSALARLLPAGLVTVAALAGAPDSAVLVTRFMSEEGVAEVVDFMPVSDEAHSAEHHRLVRIVRVVRRQMRLEFELFPAFDYGRAIAGMSSRSVASTRPRLPSDDVERALSRMTRLSPSRPERL